MPPKVITDDCVIKQLRELQDLSSDASSKTALLIGLVRCFLPLRYSVQLFVQLTIAWALHWQVASDTIVVLGAIPLQSREGLREDGSSKKESSLTDVSEDLVFFLLHLHQLFVVFDQTSHTCLFSFLSLVFGMCVAAFQRDCMYVGCFPLRLTPWKRAVCLCALRRLALICF